jgi:hypothetical protein
VGKNKDWLVNSVGKWSNTSWKYQKVHWFIQHTSPIHTEVHAQNLSQLDQSRTKDIIPTHKSCIIDHPSTIHEYQSNRQKDEIH